MVIRQFIFIAVIAAALGFGVNLVSSNKIPVIGDYREISSGGDPVIPPEAEEGDPPFINLSRAQVEFNSGGTLFVDARDEEEFRCGTIPGAINVPFEYMPDGDLGHYFDSCFGGASVDKPMVIFCSGEECDLSLHLGRNIADYGYTNVLIFFGGAREWENSGLKMERREDCSG